LRPLTNAERCQIRETKGSKRGSVEFEIEAPQGYAFEGERHGLIVHGATVKEARALARREANETALVECRVDNCDCREDS